MEFDCISPIPLPPSHGENFNTRNRCLIYKFKIWFSLDNDLQCQLSFKREDSGLFYVTSTTCENWLKFYLGYNNMPNDTEAINKFLQPILSKLSLEQL